MEAFYSDLYQKGFYDEFPEAKSAVREFLKLASNASTEYAAYQLLNSGFLEDFKLSTLQKHLTDFDNPIFGEDRLFASLYRDVGKIQAALYDYNHGLFTHLDRQTLKSFLMSTYLNKEAWQKLDLNEQKELSQMIGTLNRCSFRSLFPCAIEGSYFNKETALIIPYLDKLNKLGFVTDESQPATLFGVNVVEQYVVDQKLHWITFDDSETARQKNATFPFVKGKLLKETFLYIREHMPEYMVVGREPDLSGDFVYTMFEVKKAKYLELMKEGKNPFLEDLIGMIEKFKAS